jgi:pyruvate formate lyase activating enzyme
MQISGFIKQSLIDYPGQIASIVFTQGCNFRCPYCHNRQLIPTEEGSIPSSEVLAYFQKYKLLLDAAVITGGEPTLQKELREFIASIKQLGLKVKLDTNGSNPKVLSELLQLKLIDYVAMDIKSELTKETYSKNTGIKATVEQLKEIRQSIGLITGSGIDHEFRTTVCRELISIENIEAILPEIGNAQQFFIQQFRPDPQQDESKQPFSAYSINEINDWIRTMPDNIPIHLRE